MSEETSSSGPIPPFVAETKRILEPIIKKPKLLIDEKLARPPFQYIFQLFATIVQTTGFGQDVFTEEDLTFDKEKFSVRRVTNSKILSSLKRQNWHFLTGSLNMLPLNQVRKILYRASILFP